MTPAFTFYKHLKLHVSLSLILNLCRCVSLRLFVSLLRSSEYATRSKETHKTLYLNHCLFLSR